ncbi:Protein BZR1-like protein 3 [Rhynchospora pubera]|uniref:Protein BZR1 homolog n=1 Tax=Rhynchospora pubera TaxID=906938 RepID=A0AAV8DS88_9POAL|nr:Protein BZR1-like protein 3 [Rhynchospora pubera]KAJ4782079.1 Protein BZR1-like protein 3 [Rhynchospora pubera]
MTSGTRVPTWRERENNRRRERRRRAIAAKIYTGLRMYGNYNLPKHCDNNEVLKALCNEAGWIVEPDGTTYRKGSKPPVTERMEMVGGSADPSPCTSYQPSPRTSYNPSPASSSFPSSSSSSYMASNPNHPFMGTNLEGTSLIPWLKNLSNTAASSKFPQYPHHLYINGSISAPVTPPSGSPPHTPRVKPDWDISNPNPNNQFTQSSWITGSGSNYASLPNSTPPSPGRQYIPDPAWLAGFQISSAGPSSPTFNLVAPNPFGLFKGPFTGGASSSRMCTPGQSGTCSPIVGAGGALPRDDVQMVDSGSDEFAFGSGSNEDDKRGTGLLKAWEGERIHEVSGSDELELTLGNSSTRAD